MSERWEQLPEESAVAYEAFAAYRDMGSDRSITKVARLLDKHRTLIGRWSRTHDWVNRAKAWDDHLEGAKLDAFEEEAVDIGARQAQEAFDLTQAILMPVRAFAAKVATDPEAVARQLLGMHAEDLAKLTAVMARVYPSVQKAERLALGMDTERSSVQMNDRSDELAIRIIRDEEASDLAHELFRRVKMGEDSADRAC